MFASIVLVATLARTPTAPPEVPAPDVRENVKKGLKWLASKQDKDGAWRDNGNNFVTTGTAYAGLAFLMEGSTLQEGQYAANLRLTLVWFEKIAQPNGLLAPADDMFELGRYMQTHATALLFLVSAYDTDDDQPRRQRIGKLLDTGITFAVAAQTRAGGWGFVTARDGGDYGETSTTAFMLQALLTAERAGLKVPRSSLDRAARYLVSATNAEGGVIYSPSNGFFPQGGDGQPLSTAAAAAVLATAERKPAMLAKWVNFSKKTVSLPAANRPLPPGSMNVFSLQQYLATARVAHTLGDTGHRLLAPEAREGELLRWSPYRNQLFKTLKSAQAADGNWPDPAFGASYLSALALITLQLDNNYLPAFAK